MGEPKPVTNRGGGKKGKSSANFPPITVDYINENKMPEDVKILLHNFINCTSTESQLAVTKSILDSLVQLRDDLQNNVVKFLIQVLFESEPKHPVKCLLMRQIQQMENIHETIIKHLSQQIQSYHFHSTSNILYSEYAKFIIRLSSCYDNFPLCVNTVNNIIVKVFRILSDCILCCIDKMRCCFTTMEKLDVSKVIHQTLHLYLNVYQKSKPDQNQINIQLLNMSYIMSQLVFNENISMDSKALCAVIQITITKSRGKWSDPWLTGYPMGTIETMECLKYWKREDSVMLCLYFALITCAPGDVGRRLDFTSSKPVAEHILTLVRNVVDITDRLSGSVSVVLCGARGLAAAADWLKHAGPKGNMSNLKESESYKKGYNSEKDDSESDLDESDSNDSESDSDISDPWLCPLEKREYEEGEVYMGRTLELARMLMKFAERHLQHHVPAVRHLAEQVQGVVMLYCLRYHPEEVRGWLKVESGQMALLRRVGRAAGGGALLRSVVAPTDLLPLLYNDHKQPHVSALLDTYIEKDCSELDSGLVFARWFPPVLDSIRLHLRPPAPAPVPPPAPALVTDILVKLLAKAVDIQDVLISYILPLIENPDATTPANLKCTLFLMNVISKSKASKNYRDTDDKWKGLINYDVLEVAILDDDDQLARLCTSCTWHGHAGARVVLAFLRDAAHRPRALHVDTLRALTQFLKGIEKEYRSSIDNKIYVEIFQKLRETSLKNLVRGANHYRRGIALFTLKAISDMHFEENGSVWSMEEVATLLRHLDDSYENNKQMALDILITCSQTLLGEAVLSNNMSSIPSLLEGVSCRVRDAEGAAYKLELLVLALPHILLTYPTVKTRTEIEPVRYASCAAALAVSRRVPSYRAAALTLLRTQLERVPITCVDERGVRCPLAEVSREWYMLARHAADRALQALEEAAPLVEATSPEGHVPYMFFGKIVEPHPYQPHLYMVGEEEMTSQTMLLYAWTCAKEAWLILARTSQSLDVPALMNYWQELGGCVARARHRAVHDHATKAYADILRRMCELGAQVGVERLGELAVQWVGGADGTRRAAGLAGLVLALAAARPDLRYIDVDKLTQIHQTGAHHAGMALLRARQTARAAHDVLPALVRHALHDADSPDAALQWACVGVVGAGVRRMAGAHAPGEGGVAPGERGRLRTAVFISRYPGLYPYILECLERGRTRERCMCASVACSLLLLSRLLPDASTCTTSAGTSTPHVLPAGVLVACGSPSYHTRRLAAAAAAANIPPTMYLDHATDVFNTLTNKHTTKNFCHGLILRLLAMIDEAGELPWASTLAPVLPPTLWIVHSPCFPLVHEYLNLIIVLVKRYPSSLEAGYRSALGEACGRAALGRVLPGAQLCAARAMGVAAALLAPPQAADLISKGLNSTVHEVCVASLECLISAGGEPDVGALPVAPAVWTALGEGAGGGKLALLDRVAHIMQTHIHLECRRLSLHVLVLEGALGHIIGEESPPWYEKFESDTWIVDKLCWYMRSCSSEWMCPGRGAPPCPRGESLYARALSTHLHTMRAAEREYEGKEERVLRVRGSLEGVARCVWGWTAGGEGAWDLLVEHGGYLASYDDASLRICILLCAASARLSEGGYPGVGRLMSPPQGEPALLLALALLDFGLLKHIDDDQYQTFENETDSELHEEGIWTDRCTDMLIETYAQANPGQTITPYILSLLKQYSALSEVCGIHLVHFKKLLNGETEINDLHYKVELFVSKLKAFDDSISMSC